MDDNQSGQVMAMAIGDAGSLQPASVVMEGEMLEEVMVTGIRSSANDAAALRSNFSALATLGT